MQKLKNKITYDLKNGLTNFFHFSDFALPVGLCTRFQPNLSLLNHKIQIDNRTRDEQQQASCRGVVPHNMARWVVGKVCLPTGEMKLRLMTAVANAYYDKDYISFG